MQTSSSDDPSYSQSSPPRGRRSRWKGVYRGRWGVADSCSFSGVQSNPEEPTSGVSKKENRVIVLYLDLSFLLLLELKKMSMTRGCLLCIKITMFIFNLIFWVSRFFWIIIVLIYRNDPLDCLKGVFPSLTVLAHAIHTYHGNIPLVCYPPIYFVFLLWWQVLMETTNGWHYRAITGPIKLNHGLELCKPILTCNGRH